MGLDLIVGIRALIDDPEDATAFDVDLTAINRALVVAGIEPHLEPAATELDVFSCQMGDTEGSTTSAASPPISRPARIRRRSRRRTTRPTGGVR